MSDSVAMTQLEVPDYDLGLRGKLVRSEKTRGTSSLAFCTIIYGLSLADDVTDTPLSNAANGYPDAALIPDESTRVPLPWRCGTDAVIADLAGADGVPLAVSPRAVLQSLTRRYADLDLDPILGYEYEMWIFDRTPGSHGVFEGHTPHGRAENAYSLSRCAETSSIALEFTHRMQQVDIEIEAFHSELGPGFFEFTLSPAPAVRAADNAVRARQYLRDLCHERGLHASFMAKPFADKSGAGGHVHSSLNRDGTNVFADDAHTLSAEGRNYLAGLVCAMPDLALLLNPYVNSYKRIDPEMFTAARATWGHDDRSTACRVLLADRTSARVEHRRPGADANPYIVAAALLAGGLHGLQNHPPLPDEALEADLLPADLGSALTRFERSPLVADLLGPLFCSSFAATRRAELAAYEKWLYRTITTWELSRHLEHQ